MSLRKLVNCPGTFARDMKACLSFKNMGFSFVAYVADSYGLKYFFEDAVSEFSKNKINFLFKRNVYGSSKIISSGYRLGHILII